MAMFALPAVAQAGDRPIFVFGNWGVGEISGRIMFYLGEGRFLDTPIPAPPHGPRWDVAYDAFPFVAVGTVAAWLSWRRRGRPKAQPGVPRRGFEVQRLSGRT